jgi:hypothetical protein
VKILTRGVKPCTGRNENTGKPSRISKIHRFGRFIGSKFWISSWELHEKLVFC